jgi:hypothetical protein
MRYFIICLTVLTAACSFRPLPGELSEINMESIEFPCANTKEKPCTSSTYGIDRVSTPAGFRLSHDGTAFFESFAGYQHRIEGFKNQYVFITPYKGTHYASPELIPRDSLFIYDYATRSLYFCKADKYSIGGIKPKAAFFTTDAITKVKSQGYRIATFVDRVDVVTKKLYVTALDLKTIDSIDIIQVDKPLAK